MTTTSVRPTHHLLTRPNLAKAWMALAVVAIALFALSVHVVVAGTEQAVTVVGQQDTAGIRAAQKVKSNLAEMDLLITQELLRPTADKGSLPGAFNAKQKELVDNLNAAGQKITLGTAETVPLANIQYERAQYQALVRDAVLADQAGDHAGALKLAGQAHEVMTAPLGLQDQAAAFDKANTYALNQSYEGHKDQSSGERRLLVLAGLFLVLVLGAAQAWQAVSFHRVVNLGLAMSTLVGIGLFAYTLVQVNSSTAHLTEAREHAFDPVHDLWQARAAAYSARQAEAQWLLGAERTADLDAPVQRYRASTGRIFRLADAGGSSPTGSATDAAAAAAILRSSTVLTLPEGSGGYLAHQLDGTAVTAEAGTATKQTLAAFGEYVTADAKLRSSVADTTHTAVVDSFLGTGTDANGVVFNRLVGAVDHTLSIDEAAFDGNAQAAATALNRVDRAGSAGALMMSVLVLWGLWRRVREYA